MKYIITVVTVSGEEFLEIVTLSPGESVIEYCKRNGLRYKRIDAYQV